MADLDPLVVRIVGDTTALRQSFRQAEGAFAQAGRNMEGATSRIDRSLAGLSTTARRVAGAFGNVLGVQGLAGLAREFVQTADGMTKLQARLKLVGGNLQDVARIASETRSSIQSTGELYARLGTASRDAGIGQRELVDITRLVNQAIRISGASALAASAGVIQFAQALASGRLQGDELRSVLENAPRLTRALADGLGVSVGQLRHLGSEGELVASRILPALLSQAGRLGDEFRDIPVTATDSIAELGNQLSLIVDSLNRQLGITQRIGEAARDAAKFVRRVGAPTPAELLAQADAVENAPARVGGLPSTPLDRYFRGTAAAGRAITGNQDFGFAPQAPAERTVFDFSAVSSPREKSGRVAPPAAHELH